MNFCLRLILLALIVPACRPASRALTPTPTAEPAWETFTNQEYGYQFEYPAGARVEVTNKGSQVKVYAGTGEQFHVAATREYMPGDVLYYLDTPALGERTIGGNVWSEFALPDGYCDADRCSPPLYALRMEAGDVLYTVTFTSQDTTNELQE